MNTKKVYNLRNNADDDGDDDESTSSEETAPPGNVVSVKPTKILKTSKDNGTQSKSNNVLSSRYFPMYENTTPATKPPSDPSSNAEQKVTPSPNSGLISRPSKTTPDKHNPDWLFPHRDPPFDELIDHVSESTKHYKRKWESPCNDPSVLNLSSSNKLDLLVIAENTRNAYYVIKDPEKLSANVIMQLNAIAKTNPGEPIFHAKDAIQKSSIGKEYKDFMLQFAPK